MGKTPAEPNESEQQGFSHITSDWRELSIIIRRWHRSWRDTVRTDR